MEEILENYLDHEESRVTDPASEAQLFLQLVRERAGLLVEVGDGQFGFVHLTFQEYLAATFLRQEMEATPEDPEAAVLKTAHCLRDIAYGDESRTDDLIRMVKSDDPAYNNILREALWID